MISLYIFPGPIKYYKIIDHKKGKVLKKIQQDCVTCSDINNSSMGQHRSLFWFFVLGFVWIRISNQPILYYPSNCCSRDSGWLEVIFMVFTWTM